MASDGGQALAVYREPVGGHWQIFCLLPLDKVAPTPYQRDLSPTHAKRLQEVVKKIDRFVDPIVVVSPQPGVYWTPERPPPPERRSRSSRPSWVPAILIPEAEVAFQILALNTEKAHNLKEKSLEVIRMYRGLAEERAEDGRGGLRVPVRGAALHHARPALRGEQALRGRRVRADPEARRQVPDGHVRQDAARQREERAAKVQRRRRGARQGVVAAAQEARDQPSRS